MVAGPKRINLTKEVILSKIDSYDIYRHYFGDFEINKVTNNHLRGDQVDSFIIGDKKSEGLTHKDFGDSYWKGDCFHLVEQIYRCNYFEALKQIDKDFGLGISSGEGNTNVPKIITWTKPEILHKPPPHFQIITRSFNHDELAWWNFYHQDIADLKRENIFAPKVILRNRRKIPVEPYTFAYFFEDIKKWKLYRPLAEKRNKDTPVWKWKWDTNVPFDYIENLSTIKDTEIGIINKSRKDRMVLRKALGIEGIGSVQAEDPGCFTFESLQYIKDNSKTQVVVSDNDKKGKQFSWWLTDKHGYLHCNVPDRYREFDNWTDFADMARGFGPTGLEEVRKHFIKKKIITE